MMLQSREVKERAFRFLSRIPRVREAAFRGYEALKFDRMRRRNARDFETWQQTEALGKPDGRPVGISHEPTLKCNLSCSMCYQGDLRFKTDVAEELSTKEMETLYDRLQVASIGLVGSEIFMRPDMMDLLERLDTKGMELWLQTNGTLFNADKLERLKRLKNVKALLYSIDGPEDLHDRIRGQKGAFRKTVESIRQTAGLFHVGVNTVIVSENLPRLKELIGVARSLGLGSWSFTFEEIYSKRDFEQTGRMLEQGLGWKPGEYEITMLQREGFPYPYEALEASLKETIEEGLRQGVKVNLTPTIWAKNPRAWYEGTAQRDMNLVCPKIFSKTVRVDHLGNVHHCGAVRHAFGNLLEQSAEEIWNSPGYVAYRKFLLEGNLLPACKRCCKVGCR